MEYKKCTKCKEIKPANEDYFYKQKKNTKKMGVYYVLTSWCRNCVNKKQAKYRKENIEECRARELEYYHADPVRKERKKAGYRAHRNKHKEEYAERLSEWQKVNPDKVREYNRYREMHKKHDITKNEWENCKNYFNYRCAYCDYPIEDHFIKRKGEFIWSDFHKEHFKHDGENDLTNLIPSCLRCNSSKYTGSFDEWYNPNNDNYALERHLKIIRWINLDHKLFIENKCKDSFTGS